MSNHLDKPCTCVFFFADGRRCQLPPSAADDDMGLCYFHANKHRERIVAQNAGRQIAQFLNTDILTACDFSAALSALFAATAQGQIKPKTATTLAYLGQLMLQVQSRAHLEFRDAFQDSWDEVVQNAATFNLPDPGPDPADSDSATSSSPSLPSHSPRTPR